MLSDDAYQSKCLEKNVGFVCLVFKSVNIRSLYSVLVIRLSWFPVSHQRYPGWCRRGRGYKGSPIGNPAPGGSYCGSLAYPSGLGASQPYVWDDGYDDGYMGSALNVRP